jgi:hypothetical protein
VNLEDAQSRLKRLQRRDLQRDRHTKRGDECGSPDERRRVLMTLDITQGALAAPLGRNPRTVRAWFAGDRSIPPDALSG